MLLDNEDTLVRTFGVPTGLTRDSFIGTSFFSCANFLSYSASLYVVRTVSANANNAVANSGNQILIKNEDVFDYTYAQANNANRYGSFVAKFPGQLGNSLTVSVCANTMTFSSWAYKNYFDNAPSTSEFVQTRSGKLSNDEMHIVVVDTTGKFSGTANTVIEKYPFVSKAIDAQDMNGQSNYYKEVIRQKSNFVYAFDPVDYGNAIGTWGQLCSDTTAYHQPATNQTVTLTGGADGAIPPASNINQNWAIFNDKDKYEISLAFVGASADLSMTIPQYVIDNVISGSSSESPTVARRDTMLFLSPRYSDVVFQSGSEATNIVTGPTSFLYQLNRSSSYIVVDCNWKYQFDQYNNVYRWVPCNADVAGLCAYTDYVAEPWYSPAGFNRGHIKNVTKLAWNPSLTYRDQLYKNGVNSIVQFTGEGTVLFGDKTLQAKPSALDRINVRRLLIVLEKAISRAAKYQLFEFNDQFTRSSFVSMVEPYLRTVQSRRGLYSYKVICDETNNTPDIIDRNAFVAHVLLQPTKSINFIELNFVITRTGVDFTYVYKTLTGAS
jgi:hypothetical protein